MSKITTFSGQPQYLQILNLANRAKIQEISKQNKYDRYAKKLDGYTHFVALLGLWVKLQAEKWLDVR